MSRFEFKLPDLGEGTIDAEIVEWHVKPGDRVVEDTTIVDVMTEKANIEVPSPVTGTVVSIVGEPGDLVPVGSVLIVFETDVAAKPAAPAKAADAKPTPAKAAPAAKPGSAAKPTKTAAAVAAKKPVVAEVVNTTADAAQKPVSARAATSDDDVLTSPSIRRRAREAGVDLARIAGSGPEGRITQGDFDAYIESPREAAAKSPLRPAHAVSDGDVEEIKVIGVRRVIAQRLSESKRSIPHFAYIEEIDITALEALRVHLNAKRQAGLTYLPFLALALIRALPEHPRCNSHYDATRGVLLRHTWVHLGVATQTPDGLKVPVVHDAQDLSLWELAQQIRRVSEAARDNSATKRELTGSTITITSLGKLGGIASTPIINAPEVAIIGVNKAVQRPMVIDGAVAIRLMMNLSASFDHRFVDGYDAAALIQSVKERLENPATIFFDA